MSMTICTEWAARKNAELDLEAYARAAAALTRMVRREAEHRQVRPAPPPASMPPGGLNH